MENDYLNHLQETDEIVSRCEGESDSELCSNCPCTDYGTSNNYSSSPNGMVSCEESHCEKAIENVEDDLISEYEYRKGELKMDNAKMNVEIDLNVLEQNIVKMTTDRIEENVTNVLVGRIMNKVETTILEKVNAMVEEKVNSITSGDIYNVEVDLGESKVNLFDYMVQQMVDKATSKSIEFSDKVDELVECIEYKSVDDKITFKTKKEAMEFARKYKNKNCDEKEKIMK